MIRLSVGASPLRQQAATLAALFLVLVFVSVASAVDLDFNVASGNYTAAGNWIDRATNTVPASPPTVDDLAYVRNNGTLTINSDVAADEMRIGYTLVITNPDYDGSGIVDAADYVLWREGGPLQNDATPESVGPEDYDLWRSRFGASPTVENIGQAGTLNWTAGKITGPPNTGGNTGGPVIRVGRHQVVGGVIVEVPGTVVQDGPTTELLLPYGESALRIGDAGSGAFSNSPLSSYTLKSGTIGVAVSSNGVANSSGTDGNRGIYVRNGTFTMTGGNIIDVTPQIFLAATGGPTAQRLMLIADQPGSGVGNEAVATVNLSGGNINVLGGFRVGDDDHTKGIVNISGTVNIVTGGDTQIGNDSVNGTGEINMSGGTFQVGRTDPNPHSTPTPGAPYNLAGRLHIGDSGRGKLNMSGGNLIVTRNVVVANNQTAAGSVINMTGGTITTGGLEMRRNNTGGVGDPLDLLPPGEYGASIIVDGPTASFITTGQGQSPATIIGNWGKALFEVRQGTAVLGGGGSAIEVGRDVSTQATVNVKGGKLTLAGPVNRSAAPADPTNYPSPVFGLTGGMLEFNNQNNGGLAHTFLADLKNQGTQLITKSNELLQVTVGNRTTPVAADFAMSSGSWTIDIGLNTVLGADWINASNGTASLTGGTLNINYLSGFTPNPNQVFRILRGGLGTTLGSVTITGAGAGNWTLQEVPITTDLLNWPLDEEIQLKYVGPGAGTGNELDALTSAVPEPSSLVLLVFAGAGLLTASGRRHRTGG